MRIIKVNAINSTNTFVREFYEGNPDFEPVCVRAITQTAGRGQRGTTWQTNAGENLTFSILYPQRHLDVNKNFMLSAAVSLAVLEVLKNEKVTSLKVKWPNDILSATKKIGGILIENILKADKIVASIIGIGLNINQESFNDLPGASSLKIVTGKNYDLDELLSRLVLTIEKTLNRVSAGDETEILEAYTTQMFRLNKVSVFQLPDSTKINGIIRGVTANGRLNVEIQGGMFRTFDLKEIQLLY